MKDYPGESTERNACLWPVFLCSREDGVFVQESKSHGAERVRYEAYTVPVGEDYPGESSLPYQLYAYSFYTSSHVIVMYSSPVSGKLGGGP